nr:immunoglobulin heavy chain junction region [Macaca mulatta]MOV38230.1 immunoglobulin heavy chain junction region [Macaca mulatta]MOV41225.1 immunoglobulin heavy chain junction region [Macaca mulatta]MOV45477.1 immunoglobulin heavy chain junction region [Macaca mulatta]MOV46351.1 immunoglobulin heavy chain junction region [Macaca mulatta]
CAKGPMVVFTAMLAYW